ncbi:trypsin-like peptidase domain-containing protein [uncultured Pseudokineococcus sp.]|uniref:S1C family serine protease n=1 Tax=uncultured Pseudokineococcus sp. TaxID=1642928 RepID=UPI002628936C|nr:trypsin-like peptidase domain-containing protein [uncultured Pseudokineococcus sp.]
MTHSTQHRNGTDDGASGPYGRPTSGHDAHDAYGRDPYGRAPYDGAPHDGAGAPSDRYAGTPTGGRPSDRGAGSPWPGGADDRGAAGRPGQGEGPAWYGGATPPPAAPGDGSPSGGRAPRDRRRPGWGALVAVGVVAALVGGGAAVGVGALAGPSSTSSTTAALAPSSSSSSSGSSSAPATTDAVDWQAVSRRVAPSVVAIQVASQTAQGEGSGVVLDDQGHVLTNYHVVNGAGSGAQMRVVLPDGRVYDDVTVVGQDAATDLAVIQIANPPSDLRPATLGDSSAVEVGQPVMAVGNPLGLSDTVTTGIVSALDRPVTTTQESTGQQSQQQLPFGFQQQQQAPPEQVVTNAIQTDAAINPGNSGGALVDAAGDVIGINSSIASTGQQAGSIGLGFAIPSNEAKRIATELIQDGAADHAWLGVTLTDTTATADGTTRLAAGIQSVTDGTPAADAGLRAGDAVTAIDGQPVEGAESLTAQLRERAPGTTVTLAVVRDGAQSSVQATLGTRED